MIDLTQLGKITSDFGPRESPTAGASSYHKGIDIVLSNDNIPAVMSGTVLDSGYNSTMGNYLKVQQVDGTTATYMHMAKQSPYKAGTSILMGATIGTQGSTGISTGKHLHYQVQDSSGNYIDPEKYMSGGTLEHVNYNAVHTGETNLSGIMGSIASLVAMLILCIFAVVLFLKAFDIKIF